jgi:Protein of unknown function (DUF4058)
MPSPFPGMNPYIEQDGLRFDFHARFLVKASERLNERLPAPLFSLLAAHEVSYSDRRSYIAIGNSLTGPESTVIELIRRDIKQVGPLLEGYRKQRDKWNANGFNVVEIDLIRNGPTLMEFESPPSDYVVVVRRSRQSRIEVYPVKLRDRLPRVRIPLLAPLQDIALDVQQLVHDVYDAAGYEHYIYDSQPDPPLNADDANWAAQFVPARPE